jgi:hypothetical protein
MKKREGRGRNWPGREKNRGNTAAGRRASSAAITLAPIEGTCNGFQLVHPRCVGETELDYEEGLEIWRAGDLEEARDAFRYALQACHDNLWVHVALGRLALEGFRDAALARGHFGYAVELARKAIPASFTGHLPREHPANVPFFHALDGLAQCLRALGKRSEAASIAALAERLGAPPSHP